MSDLQITLPTANVKYSTVGNPDYKFNSNGNICIIVECNAALCQNIIKQIDFVLDDLQKHTAKNSYKNIAPPILNRGYVVETDTDIVVFKPKTCAEFIDKDNNRVQNILPIFDIDGNLVTDKVKNIGKGSIVNINCLIKTYNSPIGALGVTLILKAVQVEKLVVYDKYNAETYGFTTKEKCLDSVNPEPLYQTEPPQPILQEHHEIPSHAASMNDDVPF